MRLRYFAWLRTRIGVGAEDVALPPGIRTAGDLLSWLAERGAGYRAALVRPELVRVAVNHDHVGLDHVLADGDEVALFPPVTGG